MDEQATNSRELSARTRAANLERIEREVFDLAIIGGGITGAGIALDAASRGLTVALVEKQDFAGGTSSRSTKLIHGGLRYLQQLHFGLVREALQERSILARLAPHLSVPLGFLVPVYSGGLPSPLGPSRFKLGLGLRLYDLLAGSAAIKAHHWLGPAEAAELAPKLETRGLRGAFLYWDCVTDDARLVIEVIKAAAGRGAVVANYARVRGLLKTGATGRVAGVEVEDALTGRTIALRSRLTVNATGVWSDEISRLDMKTQGGRLRPSKGIHVVVPSEKFENRVAVLIPSLGEQRFLFVVPWCGRVVIGTTDTDYSGDLDAPAAQPEEVGRMIESTARCFPAAGLSVDDVISTFAGLRPLVSEAGKPTTEVSRKEEILESSTGLISIIGGKLTTYRRMAERVVSTVARRLAREGVATARTARGCLTDRIPLAGPPLGVDYAAQARLASSTFDLPTETVCHLMRAYGGNYRRLLETASESADLRTRLVRDLPDIAAQVVYAAREEMAMTVADVLSRRTRISLLASGGGQSSQTRVADLLERELSGLVVPQSRTRND